MELKGTKTEKNLWEAFAGESQARNKYTFFASVAKKEGYEQLAAIFEETAANEKEHAKMWFKALHGGSVPDTMTCLEMAAGGEHDEWTEMYPRMAKEAKEEGFPQLGRPLHHGGPDREGARRALPRAGREPEEQQGLCPRGAAGLAVPELRLYLHRQVCSPQVPRLRTSPELF